MRKSCKKDKNHKLLGAINAASDGGPDIKERILLKQMKSRQRRILKDEW